MNRVAAGLAWAVLMVGCACTQEKTNDRQPDQVANAGQVDPMVFVIRYRNEIDGLLQKHANDCESTLAALVRFVADHRQAFNQWVRGKPPDWQPSETQSQRSVDLLMDFGSRCPEQIARLNQAIHSVSNTVDDS